jgi:hypothetical protein
MFNELIDALIHYVELKSSGLEPPSPNRYFRRAPQNLCSDRSSTAERRRWTEEEKLGSENYFENCAAKKRAVISGLHE